MRGIVSSVVGVWSSCNRFIASRAGVWAGIGLRRCWPGWLRRMGRGVLGFAGEVVAGEVVSE